MFSKRVREEDRLTRVQNARGYIHWRLHDSTLLNTETEQLKLHRPLRIRRPINLLKHYML